MLLTEQDQAYWEGSGGVYTDGEGEEEGGDERDERCTGEEVDREVSSDALTGSAVTTAAANPASTKNTRDFTASNRAKGFKKAPSPARGVSIPATPSCKTLLSHLRLVLQLRSFIPFRYFRDLVWEAKEGVPYALTHLSDSQLKDLTRADVWEICNLIREIVRMADQTSYGSNYNSRPVYSGYVGQNSSTNSSNDSSTGGTVQVRSLQDSLDLMVLEVAGRLLRCSSQVSI